MNETFERINQFMKSLVAETPMKPGEGAVIVLALTRHECEEGESRTSAMVQGTGSDLEELLFYTLVRDDKMRSIVLEAMKAHLLKSIIPNDVLKEMTRRKNPSCDEPTAADPSEVQPTTADPDAPDTDAHTTGTEAKA